jgi:transposase
MEDAEEPGSGIRLYKLAQQFEIMVRKCQKDKLDTWITACSVSGIPDLVAKVYRLQEEHTAIKASPVLSYRNSSVGAR